MASGTGPVVRNAGRDDVAAVCRFGAEHIPPHYAPLIGAEAAQCEGFTVERVDPGPSVDAARGVVWRVRRLAGP